MKTAFPVEFDAFFAGKSRASGDFVSTDGDRIEYGEQYLFLFESAEGLSQTVAVGDKRLLEIGFDTHKSPQMTPVHFQGDVIVNDSGRSYFAPTECVVKKTATAS